MRSKEERVSTFVEPFAGGASVALAIAAAGLADRVVLVERDPDVAAVWKCVLGKDAEALATKIVEFDLTTEAVRVLLASTPTTTLERAFRTIVWNRVSHGGRMTQRAGLLREGERSKGLKSRWYPVTLATRIRAISALSTLVTFYEGDAFDYLPTFCDDPNAVLFIDPPYSATSKGAGERLYSCSELDHEALFERAQLHVGTVLLTYANDPTVRALATRSGFSVQPVLMRTTHHADKAELLISRDVAWVKPAAENIAAIKAAADKTSRNHSSI